MTYADALAYVASLEPRGWRLGLDRMQEFCRRAGLGYVWGEGDGPRFIHVAGTNGKGSVTAFLQSLMVEHGFTTGAFFSPFVVDPRERVQIGREMISETDFADVVADLIPVAESLADTEFGGITEFEFKTAVGFEFWRRRGCEWVALEVGLGGRLDATNVVRPAASAIVSIGMDHMHILGNSLEAIAREKAGIVKPGVPVVIGEMAPEARTEILSVASESQTWVLGKDVRYERRADHSVRIQTPRSEVVVEPSLLGPIQAHNVAVAYAAFEAGVGRVGARAAVRGIATAAVPGRLQQVAFRGRRFILDGAHNPDAARVLVAALAEEAPGRLATVVGMVKGHEPAAFLNVLEPVMSTAHFAPIDFHRSLPPQEVASACPVPAAPHGTLAEAIEAACVSTPKGGTILVTGSFYLVGEAIRFLRSGEVSS